MSHTELLERARLERLFESMDAEFFSGDMLCDRETRAWVSQYVAAWQREIDRMSKAFEGEQS